MTTKFPVVVKDCGQSANYRMLCVTSACTMYLVLGRICSEVKENRWFECPARQNPTAAAGQKWRGLCLQLDADCCCSSNTERIPDKQSLLCVAEQALAPELIRVCSISLSERVVWNCLELLVFPSPVLFCNLLNPTACKKKKIQHPKAITANLEFSIARLDSSIDLRRKSSLE